MISARQGAPRTVRGIRRAAPAALFSALVICLTGCSGNASLNVISLDYSAIDPQSPPSRALDLDECYWWQGDEATLHIAMRKHLQIPFMGPVGSFTIQTSITPGDMPAGRERQYELSGDDALVLAEIGPAAVRFQCILGGVSVARDGAGQLRGNLRMEATREVLQLFGGWGKPTTCAWSGTFTAVADRQRGEAIERAVRERFRPEPTTEPAQP